MMSVQQERVLLLRHLAAMEIPWRTHGLLLRAVLAVLTALGLLAFWFLLDELKVPGNGVVAGAIALVAAEVLIHGLRWWWTGVEEALWIGSMFCFVSELPNSGLPEAALVLALAAAIPGWRMRNPLFGAAAAYFLVQYFEKRFDLGVMAAMVIATLAVLALLRTWRRPSTEWLFIAIAVSLPLLARAEADEVWRDLTIVLYASFGVLTLYLAIRKRHHALFLSGAIAMAIAATDLAEYFDYPPETKLAAAGALLLVGSWLAARALKEKTQGIVATPAKLTPFDDELESIATVHIPQQNFEQRMESGGEFGGAGATGKY